MAKKIKDGIKKSPVKLKTYLGSPKVEKITKELDAKKISKEEIKQNHTGFKTYLGSPKVEKITKELTEKEIKEIEKLKKKKL